jgi:hypothetical protein
VAGSPEQRITGIAALIAFVLAIAMLVAFVVL